jgi:hypothetical protein
LASFSFPNGNRKNASEKATPGLKIQQKIFKKLSLHDSFLFPFGTKKNAAVFSRFWQL